MSADSFASHGLSWADRAARAKFTPGIFTDGKLEPATGEGRFDTVNPATGETLSNWTDPSDAQIDKAVAAAEAAFDDARWAGKPAGERRGIIHRLAGLIRENAERLALFESLEMGKPISHSLAEVEMAASLIAYYAELIDKPHGSLVPSQPGVLSQVRREPIGVIGAIVPWNFPLCNASLVAAPALAAGNCLILKPSEITPSSALALAELALAAGVPPGVFNVIPGQGSTVGTFLARHAGIGKLHFTGSTQVGRQMLRYSAESNGKAVMLECGGKSPQIVFDDALDAPGLIESLLGSAFYNAGQVCIARTRLLVQGSVKQELLSRLESAAEIWRPGDPLEAPTAMGPLASAAQKKRVMAYLTIAGQTDGSNLLPGTQDHGCYVSPVMLDDVKPDSRIFQEEIFGPVLAVTAFDDVDDAIRLANDTPYGLAATVWTSNLSRAQRLSEQIRAGRIDVRASGEKAGCRVEQIACEPFKASGFGAIGGVEGMYAYTRLKAVQFFS